MKSMVSLGLLLVVALSAAALTGCQVDGGSSDLEEEQERTKGKEASVCSEDEPGINFAACSSDGDCYSGFCDFSESPPYCHVPTHIAREMGSGYDCSSDADCNAVLDEDVRASGVYGECANGDIYSGCSFYCDPGHEEQPPEQPAGCDDGRPGSFTGTGSDLDICLACIECTQTSSCSADWSSFSAAPGAEPYWNCLAACTTDSCLTGCDADYPAASNAFYAALSCSICVECPVNCDAASVCE